MQYTIKHISKRIPHLDEQLPFPQHQITELAFDSRQLVDAEHSLFFAIAGATNDGHSYIAALIANGVTNFVITKADYLLLYPHVNFIVVENSVTALQSLGAAHRAQFDYPVVGITGSNGKTIIKEWLYQLLSPDVNMVRSPRSYNSQIGVPLSLWEMQAHHELAVFEAGISQKGEMERIARLIAPDIALFTNIGTAHKAGFKNRKEKLKEKYKLLFEADTVLLPEKISVQYPVLPHQKILTYGRQDDNDLQIVKQRKQQFILKWQKDTTFHLHFPFRDAASIENLLLCTLFCLQQGMPIKVLQERIQGLHPVGMRLEVKKGVNDCLILNDTYNSDLTSLGVALQFLQQQEKKHSRTVILSDILQTGKLPQQLYKDVAKRLEKKHISRVFGIGTAIKALSDYLPSTIEQHYFPSTNAFINQVQVADFQKEIILIKGARAFQMERIGDFLSHQLHRTTLEVNLKALIHNVKEFSTFLSPSTKRLVMVKAGAYGAGSSEVAKLLEHHKIDYLGVAYPDEGVRLREAGVELPILVLNADTITFEVLLSKRLEPEIFSIRQLKALVRFINDRKEKIGIHLKINTGMNRLGFDVKDIPEVIRLLKSNDQIQVFSIFSHLAASGDKAHTAFCEQQYATFQKLYDSIVAHLPNRPFRHILNSSGIHQYPAYQMDMVRLGIGIYGIDSDPAMRKRLEIVNTFRATIAQIRTVPAGETVGYQRAGIIKRPTRIATVSVGYADGLLRAAGNGRYQLYIHGKPAPTVGNICMDMCMVDVSQIPAAREGDEVIIFGKEPKVERLAAALGTIPYEIFTNISDRVPRVWLWE